MVLGAADVLQILGEAFPSVSFSRPRFLGGESCAVFETAEGFIFRFPRIDEVAFDLREETKLLEFLGSRLSLSVPSVVYASEGTSSFPRYFVGYRKIAGVSLVDAPVFSNSQQRDWALRLGSFLDIFHRINISELKKHGLDYSIPSASGRRKKVEDMYQQVCSLVFPHISHDERKWSENYFAAFLGDHSHFRYTPTLAHNDFDRTNILVDPKSGRLTGVIDFEGASFDDPAVDFVVLAYELGSGFMDTMLSKYRRGLDSGYKKRMKMYWNRCPFFYLLAGVQYNMPELWGEGVRMLKNRMVTY